MLRHLWIVLAVLLSEPCYAGVYLEGGVGIAYLQRTVYDGTWYQQQFPHSFDLKEHAWRVVLGYNITPQWAIQAGVVSLGAAKVTAEYVADEDYDQIKHVCTANCNTRQTLIASDSLRVYEVTIKRMFQYGDWTPYLRAGPALMTHRLTVNVQNSPAAAYQTYGRIPTVVAAGGLCYGMICGEVAYYRGLGGMDCLTPCRWPIAKEAILPSVSIHWEF